MIDTRISLLLLPSPSPPYDYESLRQRYETGLTQGIHRALKASVGEGSQATILHLALPCPFLEPNFTIPRSRWFAPVQKLLAAVYRLSCIICSKLSIDIRGQDGIDIRIILLYPYSPAKEPLYETRAEVRQRGPLVDISTLAKHVRKYRDVGFLDKGDGQVLFDHFVRSTSPQWTAQADPRIEGGPEIWVPSLVADTTILLAEQGAQYDEDLRHHTVAVGGTFDHLHAGHKLLLTMTLLLLEPPAAGSESGERMVVGITGAELLKNKKYAEYLDSWTTRQQQVSAFIHSIASFGAFIQHEDEPRESAAATVGRRIVSSTCDPQHSLTLDCVELSDPFGPTITEEAITALVISAETRDGGKAVNDRRQEKGWSLLTIFEVEVLDSHEAGDVEHTDSENPQSFNSKISSTALRRRDCERAKFSR